MPSAFFFNPKDASTKFNFMRRLLFMPSVLFFNPEDASIKFNFMRRLLFISCLRHFSSIPKGWNDYR